MSFQILRANLLYYLYKLFLFTEQILHRLCQKAGLCTFISCAFSSVRLMSHALNIFFLLNKETIRYLRSGLFYNFTETELLWWLRPHTHTDSDTPPEHLQLSEFPSNFLQFYLGQSLSFLLFH